jgi:hypothetical protein
MPSGSEVLRDGTIGGEEALGLPGRFESLHPPLALAGGLVWSGPMPQWARRLFYGSGGRVIILRPSMRYSPEGTLSCHCHDHAIHSADAVPFFEHPCERCPAAYVSSGMAPRFTAAVSLQSSWPTERPNDSIRSACPLMPRN